MSTGNHEWYRYWEDYVGQLQLVVVIGGGVYMEFLTDSMLSVATWLEYYG